MMLTFSFLFSADFLLRLYSYLCCFGYSSAYQFYSREQSSLVRESLLSEGKDGGMGAVVQVVSANVSTVINLYLA
jgi:hypothetical protein